MVDLPRGAIIYNHKQTEELLKNGHTSRGKLIDPNGLSFAEGNAHIGIVKDWVSTSSNSTWGNGSNNNKTPNSDNKALNKATSSMNKAADSMSDAADEFSEMVDWIDVLFERIDSSIAEQEAIIENKLDNVASFGSKNANYSAIITKYTQQMTAAQQAAAKYQQLAQEKMAGLPDDIVDKIKNGAIDVQEITDEEISEKISTALDYLSKAADYNQKVEESVASIAQVAKEQFDDLVQSYENESSLIEHLTGQYQARNDLLEAQNGFKTETYLKAEIKDNERLIELYKQERAQLKYVLQLKVAQGKIKVNSQEWYDMVNAIYDVDDAIVDVEAEIEDLQNVINDLHWDQFDELINRFDYIGDEISNMIQLVSHQVNSLVEEDLAKLTSKNWANAEGITTIGLYAQEMERAQYVANQYAKAIQELKSAYASGRYNETEYLSKLNELISAQYESIEKYYDAKDAIIELNEARVDAIKDGIEEEIDAYSELIKKKKELLDEEKALHDFQNTVAEQEADIAKLQKQLAAMAGDTTAATVAKRKQLEEELKEAQKNLEETYYDHSMDAKQEALDKELSNFEEEKNAEVEKWEEWLEDTETVVSESLDYIQTNTDVVYNTLSKLGNKYSLTLSESLIAPWRDGVNAIDAYSPVFKSAISNFTSQLDTVVQKWKEIAAAAEAAALAQIQALQQEANLYPNAGKQWTSSDFAPSNISAATIHQVGGSSGTISIGSTINAGNAKIYRTSSGTGGGTQYFGSDPIYTVIGEENGYLKVRWHDLSGGTTGWFKKEDVTPVGGGSSSGGNGNTWADSNNKTIEDYSKAYFEAKEAGDVAGMIAANNAANAIRVALGQAVQSAGQDIANVANSIGYGGSSNSSGSSSNLQKEIENTYKDSSGKTIADYSKAYFEAKERGDAAGMQAANDAANAIRTQIGLAQQSASKDIANTASSKKSSSSSSSSSSKSSSSSSSSSNISKALSSIKNTVKSIIKKNKYASGVKKVKQDELSIIDELGEELVINIDSNGRLKYLEKGSGVVPADLTERIIDFATDPTSAFEGMTPKTNVPDMITQSFNVNLEFGELVHIDSVSKDTLPELQKMVRTEFNSLMKEVNNGLRRGQKAK